jgi:alpha-maltose-1-phosphate synthase
LKALFLSNEYPPNTYGGAGIHVEYLVKELTKKMNIDVRCFGNQNIKTDELQVTGYPNHREILKNAPDLLKLPLGALLRNISFNCDAIDSDIVHCHTWYSHFGGILAKLLYKIPLVITTHSLEPLRPWKREQIGSGYDLSSWLEKTALEMADAIIAVSEDTKTDILNHFNIPHDKIYIIPNGIDLAEYQFDSNTQVLTQYNIPLDKPYLLFVGRITKQKGLIHLIHAIQHIDNNISIVLCAGAPDTQEIMNQIQSEITQLQAHRNNIIWIDKMLPRKDLIQLYSHAAVFCCPSIYEPFGIINLEAMACSTPVVASNVGGIKEIVVDDITGKLISFEQETQAPFKAKYPEQLAKDLAAEINRIALDKNLSQKMGTAGRKRVEEIFSWSKIADQVINLYQKLIKDRTNDTKN